MKTSAVFACILAMIVCFVPCASDAQYALVDAGPLYPGGIQTQTPGGIVVHQSACIGNECGEIVMDNGAQPSIVTRQHFPDGGGQVFEPFSFRPDGVVETNVASYNGTNVQTEWQYDTVSNQITYWAGIKTVSWIEGVSGGSVGAAYPGNVSVTGPDQATAYGYFTPSAGEATGQTPGLMLNDGMSGWARIQTQTYNSGPYLYVEINLAHDVATGNNNLDNTLYDAWQTVYYSNPASPSSECITDNFFTAGTNPRTGTAVRSLSKSGNEILSGSLTANTFIKPGTVTSTCSSATEGALLVKAGGGSTPTKECFCANFNGTGTYQWVSINLGTGAFKSAGGTTTVCP